MATKTSSSTQGQTNGKTSDTNGQHTEDQKKNSELQKFFMDQLKDIYYAEQQLLKALNEMKSACTTEELEDAFEEHQKQTERQVKRLEKVFQLMDEKPEGKKCEAMDGLIKEAKSIISETKEGTMTRDAALIIAAQKVEHYEIATYGGLVALALTLGKNRAAHLLDKTLQEESDIDEKLTDIAEEHINFQAEEEDEKSGKEHEIEMPGSNYN
jgi:ferritin-like metal-binding protein YciE